MKTLLVVATFVACLLLSGFQQAPSSIPQKPKSKVAPANQQKADSGKGSHGAASRREPATDAADKNATGSAGSRENDKVEVTALPPEIAIKQIKDSIDRTIFYCTVVLTLVGVVGMGVGVWTLRAIKDQAMTLHEHSEELRKLAEAARDNAAAANKNAEATEKNATAAKASADGLTNAERAWLLIDEIKLVPIGNPLLSPTPRFTYKIKNFGKTPAVMLGHKSILQVGNSPNEPPDLSFLEFGGAELDLSVVPQGESVSKNGKAWQSYLLPDAERGKVQTGESILWACGCLHYEDVFGRRHQTPFCWIYDVSFEKFHAAGLPHLNRPT